MAKREIQRPYTQILIMADIVNKFQGAERFTKFDLKNHIYHQIVLEVPSRDMTTFHGHESLNYAV
jgi:hypothetical protein